MTPTTMPSDSAPADLPDSPDATSAPSADYEICIAVRRTGISVYEQPLEASEPEPVDGDVASHDRDPHPVQSFEEALRAVVKIFQAHARDQDESDMAAGHQAVTGRRVEGLA